MWQDYVFAAVALFFAVSLLPMLFADDLGGSETAIVTGVLVQAQ